MRSYNFLAFIKIFNLQCNCFFEGVSDITQLNDDVLLEILSWVNVFDGINFINSCHRMNALSELYAKKFANFDFSSTEKDLSLKEANQLLHLIGKSLTKLDTSKMKLKCLDGNAMMKAITKQCLKLQELNITLPYCMMLQQPLPGGLKSLSIYSCELESDSIAEQVLKRSWKSLQTLRMFDMAQLNGSFLEKFQNVTELQLENFATLSLNNLVNFFKQNKTLRILTIRSCTLINESVIPRICALLPELEILNLDVFSKASKSPCGPLNKLKNLKVLRMQYFGTDSTYFTNSMISKISTNKCLQELYINGTNNLTQESIQSLSTMNLQKLEFFNCLFVDKKFLLMIADMFKLIEVSFTMIKNLDDDALLAFAVKTSTLNRLNILLCPVSLAVKTVIASTIQLDVDSGKREPLIVDIRRPVG